MQQTRPEEQLGLACRRLAPPSLEVPQDSPHGLGIAEERNVPQSSLNTLVRDGADASPTVFVQEGPTAGFEQYLVKHDPALPGGIGLPVPERGQGLENAEHS
eukprot:11811422-Alexandrium_andersonii.AAC.1